MQKWNGFNKFKEKLADNEKLKVTLGDVYLGYFPEKGKIANKVATQTTFTQKEVDPKSKTNKKINLSYYKVNLAEQLNKMPANERHLENVFYNLTKMLMHGKKSQAYDLLCDERILKFLNADYRLLLLDGTEDFVLNYYPALTGCNKSMKLALILDNKKAYQKTKQYKQTITYKSLALIDQNGNCVCVFPFANYEQIITNVPKMKVTVKQIQVLLEQESLFHQGHNYVFKYMFETTDSNYNVISTSDLLRYHKKEYQILNSGDQAAIDQFYQEKIADNLKNIENVPAKKYISKHLIVKTGKNGQWHMTMPKTNSYWEYVLNNFISNNLYDICFAQENIYHNRHRLGDLGGVQFDQNLMDPISNKIGKTVNDIATAVTNSKQSGFKTKTAKIPIAKVEQTPLKPLGKQNGLHLLLTGLSQGKEHRYYVVNKQLTTIEIGDNGKKIAQKGMIDLC